MVSSGPEITWSIMHPVKMDVSYLSEVISAADRYRVDSFEVCGDVHGSTGNLDGAIRFRDYPAAGRLDPTEADSAARQLRELIALAHRSGRPVYYWHREVMVPRELVEAVPGLLDENGELDLLGTAYRELLRSKLREFFDRVPDIDGIVLTLTESDYSVIHNSDPERYPPQQVVAELLATFAEELGRRTKRFILRSFGSVEQDYIDILAAADQASGRFPLEVETKITPYDFSPFLEFNPFLRASGKAGLSAEYDSLGEFLGAGYLPAADPARMIASVAFARDRQVTRHVIRVDRIGHATFASTQAVNLLAFDRAIRTPGITPDEIWQSWAAEHWPQCPADMTAVMQTGIEMVKKTHFIDGHVIFHAFPIQPEMRWIKACGILSIFHPGISLQRHQGMWGILPARTTPSRDSILEEKDAAVRLADNGLRRLRDLQPRLSEAEFLLAETAWRNATLAARLIRSWCRCLAAYFDDQEAGRPDRPHLDAAIVLARREFERVLGPLRSDGRPEEPKVRRHEYGDPAPVSDGVEQAYARPIWQLIQLLVSEYDAEFAERARWRRLPSVVDCVVCGSVTDDYRVIRYMHASHARLIDGRPARAAGNRVFPNGFIECELAVPPRGGFRLVIEGAAPESKGFLLTSDGTTAEAVYNRQGQVMRSFGPERAGRGPLRVRIQKSGASYPWIHGLAIVADPA